MKYLLDTNICIFVIRQKPPIVLQRFQQFLANELAISAVTLAELRYGADKSSNPAKNHLALDGFLAAIQIVDFDSQAAELYGQIRADLEKSGTPIGPLDTLIAAHALRHGVPVVTNNSAEFSRVNGLIVEDWTLP